MRFITILGFVFASNLASYLVGKNDGWKARHEATLPRIDRQEKTISGTLYPCLPEHISIVLPERFTALDTVGQGMVLVRNGEDTLGYYSIY